MEEFSEIIRYLKKDSEGATMLSDIEQLKNQNKHYSDLYTLDEKNTMLQYVQLVQEGGGTLGICLVGFTFVMEYLGIRFLKLAGTSAGAINTYFMAALAKSKNEAVTPRLFKILSEMDMFSFVDGAKIAKFFIKSIISKDGWISKLVITYLASFTLVLLLPIISLWYSFFTILYSVSLGLFALLTLLILYLLYRFKKSNYGINPGKVFTKFLMQLDDIQTKKDLDERAKFSIDDTTGEVFMPHASGTQGSQAAYKFYLRETPNNIDIIQKFNAQYNKNYSLLEERVKFKNLRADYTFVTVDVESQRKIEFPMHAGLYWSETDTVHPALYVRASMAIPIFFEPLLLPIDATHPNIQNAWKSIFISTAQIPQKGILIDGGSISNFPISIFHNDKIIIPRLPVMGLRINDVKITKPSLDYNFAQFAGKIIGTLKTHYDKDFLTKNNFYERYAISDINTNETEANWLDFAMSKKNKRALFLKGVEAAISFLNRFDWNAYKEERARVYYENNSHA